MDNARKMVNKMLGKKVFEDEEDEDSDFDEVDDEESNWNVWTR